MLANYTTTIAVVESMAEIEKMLMDFGASQIGKQYANSRPVGIDFTIQVDGHPLLFRLPIKPAAAHRVLNGYKLRASYKKMEHAEKVSWRILRDWTRTQLAMVEMKQAEMAQVFLPYAVQGDVTAYDAFRLQRSKQLGDGRT